MEDIDVRKLESSYLEATAELRNLHLVISNLKSENEHLRHIIEVLITNKNS